jgi:hypothetical protein
MSCRTCGHLEKSQPIPFYVRFKSKDECNQIIASPEKIEDVEAKPLPLDEDLSLYPLYTCFKHPLMKGKGVVEAFRSSLSNIDQGVCEDFIRVESSI